MTIEEVREYANVLGILSLKKFVEKDDLIRTIQLAMIGDACFGLALSCSAESCEWKRDCPSHKTNAEDEKCRA